MKLNIICIGKLQKEFKTLFEDYKKKISFYAQVNIIELKEVNHKNISVQKEKETELILNAIPKGSRVILCALNGKQLTSPEFADFISEDNMTFIIGGSHGVDENKFKEKINFSKMTFPHQMFRVLLIEQIFRAFAIKNSTKYHK